MIDKPTSSELIRVVQQLILLAFFFAMRSCEYLNVDNSYWGNKEKERRTKPLTPRSFQFWDNHVIVPHTSPKLRHAQAITITFFFQKRDDRNDPITQNRTGDKRWCPVRAAAAVIERMRQLVKSGWLTEDEYLDTPIFVYETTDGKKGAVTGKAARKILQEFISQTSYRNLGLFADKVGLHSIRSAAAMAMYMNKVPVYTIMLMGRWSSDAFLRYIRKQVEEFGSDVSQQMIKKSMYHQVILASDDDPRNHNPNAFTANMGMGRNGNEHNSTNFAVWS